MESRLFPTLTSEDVARIAARTTEIHVEAGNPIDFEKGLYFLIQGRVEIVLNGRVIRRMERGDGLGLAAALGIKEEREGFSSRAAVHSHLLAITQDDFHDVLSEFPEVTIALPADAPP
jgi:CRP-like cAMP-binding protein